MAHEQERMREIHFAFLQKLRELHGAISDECDEKIAERGLGVYDDISETITSFTQAGIVTLLREIGFFVSR